MALFDLPLDELRTYRSASAEPEDFDSFWAKTLQEARDHDLAARFEPVDTPLKTVTVHDVTFAGFGGHPIKGWLTVRRGRTPRCPRSSSSSGTAADADSRTRICCGRRPASRTS